MAMNPRRLPKLNAHEIAALQAGEEVNDAFMDASTAAEVAAAAQAAFAVSPLCVDVYVNLALQAARGAAEKLFYWRMGVLAGELALGAHVFAALEGEFWLHSETRPYMRAKHGLAECLWAIGEHAEAVEHLQHLLVLNPNDNQGIRYLLVNYLLETGADDAAEALVQEYREDGAMMSWPAALIAFRRTGDSEESRTRLSAAMEANPHVAAYLNGTRKLPKKRPDAYEWGERSEAILYAAEAIPVWTSTPGAVVWLTMQVSRHGT